MANVDPRDEALRHLARWIATAILDDQAPPSPTPGDGPGEVSEPRRRRSRDPIRCVARFPSRSTPPRARSRR